MNFLISWPFIFGIGPPSGLGVFGVGIASSLIRILIVIAAAIILARNSAFHSFHFKFETKVKDFTNNKIDTSMTTHWYTYSYCGGLSFCNCIHNYGLWGQSFGRAYDWNASRYAYFGDGFGISSAAATIAAWYREDGNNMALKQLRMSVTVFAVTYVLFLSGVVYLSYEFILTTIFDISSDNVVVSSWELLPLILLSFAFGTLGAMLNGILVGLLDTFWSTIVVAISYWGIGIFGGDAHGAFF
ncbi:hypothetical protein [Bartonella sp. OT172YNZD]|uniref:hypothetical protein n=1 Tax=Bartonella sp. OT172YNZD TaxID=3243572 RepID=UPI0035CF5AD1